MKNYLSVMTTAFAPLLTVTANMAQENKSKCALVSPIDADSVVVTWSIDDIIGFEYQNDLTRYTITVERNNGCTFVPIVKFQVPVSLVPKNDCEQVERSIAMDASQEFRVKICAGDLLFVSITKSLAQNCPLQCGVPVAGEASTVNRVEFAFVSVYLS